MHCEYGLTLSSLKDGGVEYFMELRPILAGNQCSNALFIHSPWEQKAAQGSAKVQPKLFVLCSTYVFFLLPTA